jgi:6,7-dimethyl-8-ribityllumazine synthase
MFTQDRNELTPKPGLAGPVAIVAAQWHKTVTDRLIEGARGALRKAGVPAEQIHLFWAAGSFELPQSVHALARTGKYRAIVPIGCIVRGETAHFDYLAQSVFQGLDQAGRATGVAVSLAVLTVDNVEQALERSGGKHGNKGEEAAAAALELARLLAEVQDGKPLPRA